MKLKLLLLINLSISMFAESQISCNGFAMSEEWNFEGSQSFGSVLVIDTLTDTDNIWQVGSPLKTIINTANSNPNVIITDTLNSYPSSDTSEFLFKFIDNGGFSYTHTAEIGGYYYVNSDTLNDYGTIEISLDQGFSWIDIISDPAYDPYIDWYSPKPTLTGNSGGWQYFDVSLPALGSLFPVNYSDTIILKFKFISDAMNNNLDGLAYDNIQFCNAVEGIEELNGSEKTLLRIVDILGREVLPVMNALLIFIYEDGTTEKRIIIE